ncbi:MAG: phosphonate transporter [Bacteroidetes bacterium SW_9_63_38]|nr:MAG: phosphonate transporter [Bacteroidetes bacterium SW_9_63_38]
MASSSDNLYSFLRDAELTPRPKSDIPIPDDADTGDASALSFDADKIGKQLHRAAPKELHNARFGIVRLDDEGTVTFYNRYESILSGVAPADALGQNFFHELAPCSNNRLFLGRFREGVAADELDERFTYTFTYRMRPTLVNVRLYRDREGRNWVLIQKR